MDKLRERVSDFMCHDNLRAPTKSPIGNRRSSWFPAGHRDWSLGAHFARANPPARSNSTSCFWVSRVNSAELAPAWTSSAYRLRNSIKAPSVLGRLISGEVIQGPQR
ncbi:uncharacterized protein LOC143907295 [Temnothorax americanus]|uniref:uncharacterized protein LOC143907295 n=1 Tax=Temnothorax americanus TaxID=1964332 RepID=UPI0040681356